MIGITTYGRDKSGNFYLPGEYVDAVRQAGGMPILLTPGETKITQIFEQVDGVIFTGGGDMDPKLYGGKDHPAISRVDAERDAFEIALAKYAINQDKPVLGICRGFQLLTVATGGDLVQHVPDRFGAEVAHIKAGGMETEHPVKIESDSRLAKIVGENELTVVSKHHQAAQTISSDWRLTAHAADGVVEAMEHKNHPWMFAVLWHPEMAFDDLNQQRIFAEMVKVASN